MEAIVGATIVLVALGPAEVAAEVTAHPCLGRWIGEGSNGGSLPWAVDLTVTSLDARCGGVEYDSPQLDCGGPFSDCRFEGHTLTVTERFTHNENCAEGRLELVCEGDSMHYSWYGWETVRTTLHRVPAPGATTPGPAPPPRERDPDRAAERPPTPDVYPPPPAEDPAPPANDDSAAGCGCRAGLPDARGAWALVGALAWARRRRSRGGRGR
jgi:hypothetical protein